MTDQLRDIKGVLGVFDWGTLLFFLLVALLLAAAGFLLLRLLKRWRLNRRKKVPQETPPQKSCQDVALEALANIHPEAYFEQHRIKEFYFDLTDIVRQFLGANYHIDTWEKTSLEILEALERVERDFEKVRMVERYFNECDLVKFAKLRPGLAEMRQKKAESEKIVRDCWRKG